jgi:hypothetical protein
MNDSKILKFEISHIEEVINLIKGFGIKPFDGVALMVAAIIQVCRSNGMSTDQSCDMIISIYHALDTLDTFTEEFKQ